MSKLKQLIPTPKSTFIQVRCPDCGNTQTIFSHAATLIRCQVCSRVLAKPTGGKVKVDAKIVKTF
ncbi:MAG: 30S ribosomal protein S27e [Candidatus Nezhaarchaeales archaeon]